ncbi:MAG: radical SAM protein [Chloroflexota bacterium]|jgi:radical SAM superfamily enzyme YgiQ (UPF0313 family)
MTRFLLINPPSPERLGTPLLGQQYVAAALLEAGCDVQVIDAAARHFEHDTAWIVSRVQAFKPDMVGLGLFTRWVWHAYQLVEALRGEVPVMVAGGAHATVRPDETLARGFDIAVIGEAERTVVELVEWVEGQRPLSSVSGIRYRDSAGQIRCGRPGGLMADLDSLARPAHAQPLYDSQWYDRSGRAAVPGGILTSRGCPARCTFCANYVTGRRFRYRSAEDVVDELNAYHERYGQCFFPCWDDALTANRRRLFHLCQVIEEEIRFDFTWSAITRATMVTPELLAAMKRAGLAAVNFGVESGDDDILRAIKKGITTDHVVQALEWAKAAGLRTTCNFMLGFPQETPQALERTLRFMERIAPMVDNFSTMGVVVPFPGTPLYEAYHQEYGFTEWWLDESYSHYQAWPSIEDSETFQRHYLDDANLALDFFNYSAEMKALIRACLRFKGEHNLRAMGLLDTAPAASLV